MNRGDNDDKSESRLDWTSFPKLKRLGIPAEFLTEKDQSDITNTENNLPEIHVILSLAARNWIIEIPHAFEWHTRRGICKWLQDIAQHKNPRYPDLKGTGSCQDGVARRELYSPKPKERYLRSELLPATDGTGISLSCINNPAI
jgi:hypothetical protein